MRYFLVAVAIAVAALYAFNASHLAPEAVGARVYLAHRGVHQIFDRAGLGRDTCTANRIAPPAHGFIENTIASAAEAFRRGAAIVEIDIHPTTDGEFAVFHDWTLECRTEGKGAVRSHDMAYLRTLDAGYGYTADGGATYPLRGSGVGAIPSLGDMLAAFPGKRFLINIKSNDPEEGALLAAYVGSLEPASASRLSVYGGERAVARFAELAPGVRAFTRTTIKKCLLGYMAIGWSSAMPRACRGATLVVPANYARIMWGWPRRFERRMREADAEVFICANALKGESMGGVNSISDLRAIGDDWRGGVWTDRIELVNPAAE